MRGKKILIIGAGMSTPVLIRELANTGSYHIIVADSDLSKASSKTRNLPNTKAIRINVLSEESKLLDLIRECDLVVSMLPAWLHKIIVEQACLERKPVVTASYMHILNQELKDNLTIPVLMETGLDPGLDHIALMATIEEITSNKGIVSSVLTAAGALPSPDFISTDDNPWKYRFSWAPYQVIRAGKKGATTVENNLPRTFNHEEVFSSARPIKSNLLKDQPPLEIYPNGNASVYTPLLPDTVSCFYRGTIRYSGFSAAWLQLIKAGLLDESKTLPPPFSSYHLWYRAAKLRRVDKRFEQHLSWLGFPVNGIKPTNYKIETKGNAKTPIELLETLLISRWKMPSGAHDIVYLYEKIDYTHQNGNKCAREILISINGTFPEESAVAKGVGITMAYLIEEFLNIAPDLSPGVYNPFLKDLYKPVWNRIKSDDRFTIITNEQVAPS